MKLDAGAAHVPKSQYSVSTLLPLNGYSVAIETDDSSITLAK
jgi:hypothetical protein